jgi:P2 family phage contractile tail tube protein
MEAMNLFAGDEDPTRTNHLKIMNVKLPVLEENMVDFAAGGAPGAIEINTHLLRLECTFALMGWQPYVLQLQLQERQDMQVFTAYGVIRDKRTAEPVEVKTVMAGRLARMESTEFRRGDAQSFNYRIGAITHYEVYFDKEEIYWWDFYLSCLRVQGEDLMDPINDILRIPMFNAGEQVVLGG